RALAGAVRTHQPDDPLVDVDRESVEGGDAAGIALRQGAGRDEGHPQRVPERQGVARSSAPAGADSHAPVSAPSTSIRLPVPSALIVHSEPFHAASVWLYKRRSPSGENPSTEPPCPSNRTSDLMAPVFTSMRTSSERVRVL